MLGIDKHCEFETMRAPEQTIIEILEKESSSIINCSVYSWRENLMNQRKLKLAGAKGKLEKEEIKWKNQILNVWGSMPTEQIVKRILINIQLFTTKLN